MYSCKKDEAGKREVYNMRFAKIAILMMLLFVMTFGTACSNSSVYPTKDSFELTVTAPQTEIIVGEEVTFTAKLTNLTDKDFILNHGIPLIVLYVRPAGDTSKEGIGAALVQTTLKAHQYTEKEINIQAAEAGDYVLRTYCLFDIDGKEFRYECDDIIVKILDE